MLKETVNRMTIELLKHGKAAGKYSTSNDEEDTPTESIFSHREKF